MTRKGNTNETWICYVQIPHDYGTPRGEFQMFADIENYACMRIENELGIRGVKFNIVAVRDDNKKFDVEAYLAGMEYAKRTVG